MLYAIAIGRIINNFAGMGGDKRETGRGWAGMEITSAGMGGGGCNFCLRAGV